MHIVGIDLADLDDFLKMAEDFGLYVLVRPGPYICAEWDTGGYPQWLLTKKPAAPLRDAEGRTYGGLLGTAASLAAAAAGAAPARRLNDGGTGGGR